MVNGHMEKIANLFNFVILSNDNGKSTILVCTEKKTSLLWSYGRLTLFEIFLHRNWLQYPVKIKFRGQRFPVISSKINWILNHFCDILLYSVTTIHNIILTISNSLWKKDLVTSSDLFNQTVLMVSSLAALWCTSPIRPILLSNIVNFSSLLTIAGTCEEGEESGLSGRKWWQYSIIYWESFWAESELHFSVVWLFCLQKK